MQQLLIFTFISQMLVLHYKFHILHFLFSSSMIFSQVFHYSFLNIFSFFAQYYVLAVLVSACASLEFHVLSLQRTSRALSCCTVEDVAAACPDVPGFLKVLSEFVFAGGTRSLVLRVGLHSDVLCMRSPR